MKLSLRSALAAPLLSVALLLPAFSANPEPGYVDFSPFLPSGQGRVVDVNLPGALLKFAAHIAQAQEPEVAEVIAGLKSVRVHVVKLDDRNRADTVEKVGAVRRQLDAGGWARIASVREDGKGENVDVHVCQDSDDVIQGLVVTVIDRKGEAVFVNIVGKISANQIAAVADKLNIEPLRKFRTPVSKT